AREESKFGFTPEELRLFFREGSWKNLSNVRLQGLMGMATFTENTEQVRQEFRLLKLLFDEIRSTYFSENESFRELSMGMTGDYKIAIQEGSTMLRIGTALFGSRKTEQ
ncbi:MAG: alanine racemase, partial [Bacteroidales bacterium]|nr:alanine racemase [Bacteroidales bacterium]